MGPLQGALPYEHCTGGFRAQHHQLQHQLRLPLHQEGRGLGLARHQEPRLPHQRQLLHQALWPQADGFCRQGRWKERGRPASGRAQPSNQPQHGGPGDQPGVLHVQVELEAGPPQGALYYEEIWGVPQLAERTSLLS